MSIGGTFWDDPDGSEFKSRVYIGVKHDASMIRGCSDSHCSILIPIFAVDIVLSAITDTLFLPYTVFSDDLKPYVKPVNPPQVLDDNYMCKKESSFK
jgi:uncharacterized protein YceK